MAAILDFFQVAPRPKSIRKSQGIIIPPKMALLSTWQEFLLADHNVFKIPGGHLKNGGYIRFFFKMAPRPKS